MRTLLVDDERSFKDQREAVVCRNSADAIEALESQGFDEVWLDFVLAGMDDTMQVVLYIKRAHHNGRSFDVGEFIVHSASIGAFSMIEYVLTPLGYKVRQEWEPQEIFFKEFNNFD